MVRFECKKCGSLVVTEDGSKTATCNICGLKQRIPMTVIKEMRLTTNNDYDPQRKHYEHLLYKAKKYRDVKILTETAEEFDRLGEFENSREMAEFCRKRIAEEQVRLTAESEKQKIEDQQKARSNRIYHFRMALLNIGVVALVIFIAWLVKDVYIGTRSYDRAIGFMSQGEYDNAIQIFENLGGYKDSEELLIECKTITFESKYSAAVETMNKGHYVSARHQFEAIKDYKDSAALALECRYQGALRFIEAGNFQTALEELTALGDYKDSKDKILICEAGLQALEAEMIEARYNNAIETMNQGRYANAQHIFTELKGYKDSDTLALECQYQKALQLMNEENYKRALEEFESIGDYKDASEKADIARSKLTS